MRSLRNGVWLMSAWLLAAMPAAAQPMTPEQDMSSMMPGQSGQMPGMGMGPGGMMAGPGMGGMGMMGMCPMMNMMMGGMGPGAMGGMGMMPMMNMMGGAGMMGPAMGFHSFGMLNLTEDQRTKLAKIQEDTRKRQWDTIGKLMEEQARLRELYGAEKPDPKQVGAAYGNAAKLRQQLLEANVDAHNRMLDVLTNEQREQLEQRRSGMTGAYGAGGRMGPGRMTGPGARGGMGTPPSP